MWASVLESEFNYRSPFVKHERKLQSERALPHASHSLPRAKHSLLGDVIRPFCSAHNTSSQRREKTSDISLPGPLCICSPVNSFFNAFVFSNWAPYCAVVSSSPLYNQHQQHEITTKYLEQEITFIISFESRGKTKQKNNPHSRTGDTGGHGRACVCVNVSRRGWMHASGSLY